MIDEKPNPYYWLLKLNLAWQNKRSNIYNTTKSFLFILVCQFYAIHIIHQIHNIHIIKIWISFALKVIIKI